MKIKVLPPPNFNNYYGFLQSISKNIIDTLGGWGTETPFFIYPHPPLDSTTINNKTTTINNVFTIAALNRWH